MKIGRVYVIDWLDHCESADTGHAWIPVTDTDAEPVHMRTVAYLVHRGPQAISVAHTMDEDHSTITFTIVRSAIISMQELILPPVKLKAKRKRKEKVAP